MQGPNRAIGLLGGSFDPVHNGHLAIAQSFLNSGYISQLWILLTPDPPHKSEQPMASYRLRYEMLVKAFRGWDNIVVSEIEKNLPRPSYSIQTLQFLQEEYPEYKFYLCIGEDSARDFKKWYRWQDILDLCELLIARRPSKEKLNLDTEVSEKGYVVDHEPVEISSTEIRKNISGGMDISGLVPPLVEKIIKEHKLYK